MTGSASAEDDRIRYRTLLVVMVIVCSPFAPPAAATRPCEFSGREKPRSSAADRPGVVRFLSDVRAGAHRCFDRAVFAFEAPDTSPPGYRIRYERAPIRQDGSGRRVAVAGQAFLVVRMAPARDTRVSRDDPERTYNGPESLAPAGGTRIVEVRHVSSFEGAVKWAIGLDKRRPYRVTALASPARLVIDVG